MKLGNIEGTPRQIRDVLKDQGLKFEDYFVPPPKPTNPRWVIVAALTYVATITVVIVVPLPERALKLLFALCCIETAWLTFLLHLRYAVKGIPLMIIACVGFLVAMLAYGVLSPRELYAELQQLRKK
jgi:hypothetical protein